MSFISWQFERIATIPSFGGFMCLAHLLLWVLILSSLIIAIIQIITDAFDFDYVLIPARIYHLIFVFPIMLFFLFLRFGIQKRGKFSFYLFAFSKWEQKIITSWGYSFNEKTITWEGKNVFGGPVYGADSITTLHNKDN